MSRLASLDRFIDGWRAGDPDVIATALADDFVFHNPRAGPVRKADFKDYFAGLRGMMDELGRTPDGPFMGLSDHAFHDDGETLTAWVWWTIPGTPASGAGLVKATDAGVVAHWVTYHAAPQW